MTYSSDARKRAFEDASGLLLEAIQRHPDGRPTADELAHLLERLKRLGRGEFVEDEDES